MLNRINRNLTILHALIQHGCQPIHIGENSIQRSRGGCSEAEVAVINIQEGMEQVGSGLQLYIICINGAAGHTPIETADVQVCIKCQRDIADNLPAVNPADLTLGKGKGGLSAQRNSPLAYRIRQLQGLQINIFHVAGEIPSKRISYEVAPDINRKVSTAIGRCCRYCSKSVGQRYFGR